MSNPNPSEPGSPGPFGAQHIDHSVLPAATEALPRGLSPMLATPGPLPHGEGWGYELKWDGIRALIGIDGSGMRIESRRGNDATTSYPELAALAEKLEGHAVLLDGEIVAFDEVGRPSFNRIQYRIGVFGNESLVRSRTNPVVLAIFDVLHLDGHSTRNLPYRDRRRLLDLLGFGEPGPAWRLSTVHTGGDSLLAATKAQDLEGVVAKRMDARYSPGVRSPYWVKVKNLTIDEFVIGGWMPGEGRREGHIGALLLGLPESDTPDAPLRWIGKVGTGFTDAELGLLFRTLEPLRQPTNPFVNDPGEKTAVFVTPRVSCRVEYREWTETNTLRFPSYKGLVHRGPNRETGDA